MSTGQYKKCVKCAKLFERKKGRSSTTWHNQKHCSLSCSLVNNKRAKGACYTKEIREKLSKLRLEKPHHKTPHSNEAKMKMRKAKLGKKTSPETKAKISASHKGANHWNYKGGITKENRLLRRSYLVKEWRTKVFTRDLFACRECSANGVYIEAHHIRPIRTHKNLLLEITNGITLCRPCHLKTFGKEELFEDKYFALTKL